MELIKCMIILKDAGCGAVADRNTHNAVQFNSNTNHSLQNYVTLPTQPHT